MREKIVNLLLNSDLEFISGEEISKQLGISRTAVWKHINVLKEQGYEIESVNKKGYRLKESPNDILSKENILHNLKTKFIGKEIIHFDSIDSTNNYAKSIANEATDGTVILSEEQVSGRGRLGKCWHSEKHEGIWMSIILKPNILPMEAPFITLVAGASIVKALRNLGVEATIKWPNDIILNGKKTCGILTELSAEIERVNYIVVGIGINVKTINFPEEIGNIATSIQREGYEISRVDIVRNILSEFELKYNSYINENDKNSTLDVCKNYSAIIGKEIYTIKNNVKEQVTCIDINENGDLVVKDKNGKLKEIISGEVSIRGEHGYV
ncbi:biotin--[acetyl-CoA-carboxylase] ligase [Paraclostridium bifermentans]|uniref:biotin--[acetyl-CoA-carboxylase] ligase n=1 Tax=Paraclostridium bifermentans TaxID=1490 RepID=UPI001C100570|nr:biotin--[acetyl-CoA-carboxylase] ligase [Paraclostridium bifermentans]MBS5953908.1 biotin--[acetyl-CoA-carboxylase] ligase [Paraclostridium bifermentans]MBU5289380.1 biotin--[acetyl-CoA-carboxylase] ligase [Paraclostridium bifermentans]MDU7904061.1 biotin--[acetyl-CoA-carboxylase] ligase [Peptostreptococcaceae bacterium]